ncbi:FeoA family protein [Rapidithrix thailandica]|uniref:FeoA family protein n=1 Tax=Rapidithrix thailandica TaxID=413964 RepID=A0AAW9RN85_9BACT
MIVQRNLSELQEGESSKVSGFVDQEIAVKLLEMGLLPGCSIKLLRTAPFGCPLYLKVNQNYLALRRKEAANIILE